ncbi:hypothetical protein BC941DRAFT_470606 [Chlamydoabsidia padenii]|nr:hypothetical protein BC941DRAFT_470606 [Chlamydoabsidia padenii]
MKIFSLVTLTFALVTLASAHREKKSKSISESDSIDSSDSVVPSFTLDSELLEDKDEKKQQEDDDISHGKKNKKNKKEENESESFGLDIDSISKENDKKEGKRGKEKDHDKKGAKEDNKKETKKKGIESDTLVEDQANQDKLVTEHPVDDSKLLKATEPEQETGLMDTSFGMVDMKSSPAPSQLLPSPPPPESSSSAQANVSSVSVNTTTSATRSILGPVTTAKPSGTSAASTFKTGTMTIITLSVLSAYYLL